MPDFYHCQKKFFVEFPIKQFFLIHNTGSVDCDYVNANLLPFKWAGCMLQAYNFLYGYILQIPQIELLSSVEFQKWFGSLILTHTHTHTKKEMACIRNLVPQSTTSDEIHDLTVNLNLLIILESWIS